MIVDELSALSGLEPKRLLPRFSISSFADLYAVQAEGVSYGRSERVSVIGKIPK